MFFIFQVPHSAMPEQERVRQCEMARAHRVRFDACHGRPGRLSREDQEGEDRNREREDENREPREGEDQEEVEVCKVLSQVWELVEDPARPPVALPNGKYKLLNKRNKPIPITLFIIFLK